MTFVHRVTAETADIVPIPRLERVRGAACVGLRSDGGVTRLRENYQSGSAKVRFPRTETGEAIEAVLLNTAGGLTGGDVLSYSVTVDAGASGIATTQAAERVYRRTSGAARIDTTLSVGEGAGLDWLPQETIVFDRSAFRRTIEADVHPAGRLLAFEAILLGRTAMGEAARAVSLSDSWRIRRGDRLVFADGLRLAGDTVALLQGGATGNGAAAMATLVLVAPDAEEKLAPGREALADAASECGVSAWNGLLVARLIAPGGQALRTDAIRLIEALRGRPMPRVWNC